MSENGLRQAFEEITAGIRPAPGAYPRLMRRHHVLRRRRAVGWTGAVTVLVVAAMLGPVGLQHLSRQLPSDTASSSGLGEFSGPITPWILRLIDSPTRGSLANDSRFIAGLTDVVAARQRTAEHGARVKVLFAGDVGPARLAIAAVYTSSEQFGVFMTGSSGVSADDLYPPRVDSDDDPRIPAAIAALKPFAGVSLSRVDQAPSSVWLAPQRCLVSMADRGAHPQWVVPQQGYLAYSGSTSSKVAQVVCDGVVRYQGFPPGGAGIVMARHVTDEQVGAASAARARGSFPVAVAKNLLASVNCDRPVGESMLLFGGAVPGLDNSPEYYVAICPTKAGPWYVQINAESGEGMGFPADVDLSADSSIVTIAPQLWPGDLHLVLAPRNATRLEVRDLQGNVLSTTPMGAGVASIELAPGQKVNLRAFDEAGNVVGTGAAPLPAPTPPDDPERIENWN